MKAPTLNVVRIIQEILIVIGENGAGLQAYPVVFVSREIKTAAQLFGITIEIIERPR